MSTANLNMCRAPLFDDTLPGRIETPPDLIHDWRSTLEVHDFTWVANTNSKYKSALHKVPQLFAWRDSKETLANVHMLDRSTAFRLLSSFIHHISLHDRDLSRSIRETFEALPVSGKLRFMLAPETSYRISMVRREPSNSLMRLCSYLNGESALHGIDPPKAGYCTALGDVYWPDIPPDRDFAGDRKQFKAVSAPHLGETIPIDFTSPNAISAKDTAGPTRTEFLDYSPEDRSLVCERLDAAFTGIERVSAAAAMLIKKYVKVIIPLKDSTGRYGSTSQRRFPGRVLLHSLELSSIAALASALVHEAMHQFLYILERAGEFVTDDHQTTVKSLWTGRDLALSSYFHACFIWYGLSRFWQLSDSASFFDAVDAKKQLTKAIAGFSGENPAAQLASHDGRIRYEALRVAESLQGLLSDSVS